MAFPSNRALRHALDVLGRLPPAALGMVAERIIDRLDAAEPDTDIEDDNTDCCAAGECGGMHLLPDSGAGDLGDAEEDDPGGDERDPDMPIFPALPREAREEFPIVRGGRRLGLQRGGALGL